MWSLAVATAGICHTTQIHLLVFQQDRIFRPLLPDFMQGCGLYLQCHMRPQLCPSLTALRFLELHILLRELSQSQSAADPHPEEISGHPGRPSGIWEQNCIVLWMTEKRRSSLEMLQSSSLAKWTIRFFAWASSVIPGWAQLKKGSKMVQMLDSRLSFVNTLSGSCYPMIPLTMELLLSQFHCSSASRQARHRLRKWAIFPFQWTQVTSGPAATEKALLLFLFLATGPLINSSIN